MFSLRRRTKKHGTQGTATVVPKVELGGGEPRRAAVAASAPASAQATDLKQQVIDVLRTVYDPEIPVNIYDLGLIYHLDVQPSGIVGIEMTLTAPGCPVAQSFPGTVEAAVRGVTGVTDVRVELVWEPPWCPDHMSEAARLELGML